MAAAAVSVANLVSSRNTHQLERIIPEQTMLVCRIADSVAQWLFYLDYKHLVRCLLCECC